MKYEITIRQLEEYTPEEEQALSKSPFAKTLMSSPFGTGLPPTSEQLKKGMNQATKDYTKAKSSGEEAWDQVIGDAAAMLTPAGLGKGIAKAGIKAVGRSALGNMAKWGTEDLGYSPTTGSIVKFGTMALSSLAGGRSQLRNMQKDLYDKSDKLLDKNAVINVAPEQKYFTDVITKFTKSDVPEKKNILERLTSFLGNVAADGTAKIQELIDLKKSWNEWLRQPGLDKAVKNQLKLGVGKVNEAIGRFGKKNPEWYNAFTSADELTGALNSQSWVQGLLSKSKFLANNLSNPLIRQVLVHGVVQGITQLADPGNILASIGSAGATLAGREVLKFVRLLSKSPIARSHYKNMMKSALHEDAKTYIKELNRLDKAANIFMQKHPGFEVIPSEKNTPKSKRGFEVVS